MEEQVMSEVRLLTKDGAHYEGPRFSKEKYERAQTFFQLQRKAATAMEAGDGGGGCGGEEEEEQVMSEVHLGCPPHFSGLYRSRFTFSSSPCAPESSGGVSGGRREELAAATTSSSCDSPEAVAVDEDGDLILSRRRRRRMNDRGRRNDGYVLTVQHGITSSLSCVGLQIWKAALLLADFVLHKSFTSSEFDGATAIEIGAGTGLVGLVQARVGRIFITDRGTDILDNCSANVHLNSSMLKFDEANVYVRELDWKMSWPPPVGTCDASDPSSRYLWSTSEIEEAEKATLLFSADVIYSDDLTDLFFETVRKLMSRGAKKVLYLTLEKRYNFSFDDLNVVANGYQHFRSFFTVQDGKPFAKTSDALSQSHPSKPVLVEFGDPDDGAFKPGFIGQQIDLAEVPQYITEYDRGKDLEMWKIMYTPD